MATYPLLFTFLEKVEGNGFLADVAVHGRLLAVEEEDGVWWMNGVQPGGVAAHGATRAEAYAEFRKTLMHVLFDIATQSRTFFDFRKAAMKFFEEVNRPTLVEWDQARQLVRAGKLTIDGMRRETAEAPRRIEIKQKQHLKDFKAKDNATDPGETVAA